MAAAYGLDEPAAGERGRVESYGTRHGRGGVACRNLARSAVNPRCGAPCSVYHPENHHQAEARPRRHKPPPERRFNQNAAQRQMGRIAPRAVGDEVVSEEEQTNNARDGRKPGASRLPGDESFPKVDDATNPEKLPGNQHHEDGGEEQEIEGPLAPIGDEPEGAKNNPQESDHTHALMSSEETDHPCHVRSSKNTARDYRPGVRFFRAGFC